MNLAHNSKLSLRVSDERRVDSAIVLTKLVWSFIGWIFAEDSNLEYISESWVSLYRISPEQIHTRLSIFGSNNFKWRTYGPNCIRRSSNPPSNCPSRSTLTSTTPNSISIASPKCPTNPMSTGSLLACSTASNSTRGSTSLHWPAS